MNKLTVVLSGKKQAGKNTACNFIIAKYLNRVQGWDMASTSTVGYGVDSRTGELMNSGRLVDPTEASELHRSGVKVYSFADPLKRFLIDVFDVPYESCYGTDAQKNAPLPHLHWESLPDIFRPTLTGLSGEGSAGEDHVNAPIMLCGNMSGREIMQVFGTDICRRIYGDCWAKGTYNAIKREGVELALVCDGRFPNEIELGSEVGAKSVRLLRSIFTDNHRSETALDDFPLDKYTVAIDNRELDIHGTCERLEPLIDQWFDDAGIHHPAAEAPDPNNPYVVARRGAIPDSIIHP